MSTSGARQTQKALMLQIQVQRKPFYPTKRSPTGMKYSKQESYKKCWRVKMGRKLEVLEWKWRSRLGVFVALLVNIALKLHSVPVTTVSQKEHDDFCMLKYCNVHLIKIIELRMQIFDLFLVFLQVVWMPLSADLLKQSK